MILSENQRRGTFIPHVWMMYALKKSQMHFHWFATMFLLGIEHNHLVEEIKSTSHNDSFAILHYKISYSFVCLGFIVPLENFSLMWTRHHEHK